MGDSLIGKNLKGGTMPRPMCKWNREGDVAEKKENEAGWRKETEMRTVKSQKETESWGM